MIKQYVSARISLTLFIHNLESFQYEKVDIYGQKPMYTAAVQSPNLDCLNLLIVAGASAEYYHRSGATLLMRTILSMPNFLIIKTLVESGACVNSREISTGRTPLHYAVMIDNLKIVKVIIQNKYI